MKQILWLVLFSIFVFQNVVAQSVEDAIKYNDQIIDQNDKIANAMDALIGSYDSFKPQEMDSLYAVTSKTIDESIKFANNLRPFKSDASFKNGALALFKVYKSVLENEHKRIIELLKLPESKYGTNEVAEYEKLVKQVNDKLGAEMEKLIAIQEKFSKTNHFDISN